MNRIDPMIAFDLECAEGHPFEGWFEDLDAFEQQSARGLVTCPYCNNSNIKRLISPVAVKKAQPASVRDDAIDYRKLARKVFEYIQSNFEDVGPRFASEALKMHYGVSDKRNIRGSATSEEEETLTSEGIGFFKIPYTKSDEDESKN